MSIIRRSFELGDEKGVLHGSEVFIATDKYNHMDTMQYLAMCGHYYCEEGYRIDRSFLNDYIDIAYIVNGCMYVHYEGSAYYAKKGNVVLMDLSRPHYFAAVHSLEFLWIHVMGTVCNRLYEEAFLNHGALFHEHERCEAIGKNLRYILSALQTDQFISNLELSVRIYEMLLHLLPDTEYLPPSDQEHNTTIAINIAVDYMKYNIGNDINLDNIADVIHMSKYHFIRLFKERMGQTPYAFLLKLRMDTAKHMLTTTQKPIKDIAAATGYQSEMGFVSAFTDKVGVSPGRYRKRGV